MIDHRPLLLNLKEFILKIEPRVQVCIVSKMYRNFLIIQNVLVVPH